MARSFTFVTEKKYSAGPRKGYVENPHYVLIEDDRVVGSIRTAWGRIGFYGPKDTINFYSGDAVPQMKFKNINQMAQWLFNWVNE